MMEFRIVFAGGQWVVNVYGPGGSFLELKYFDSVDDMCSWIEEKVDGNR